VSGRLRCALRCERRRRREVPARPHGAKALVLPGACRLLALTLGAAGAAVHALPPCPTMAMARAEAEMVMFESVRQVLAACDVAARQVRRLRCPGLCAWSTAAKRARFAIEPRRRAA